MEAARELECVRRSQSGDHGAFEELIRATARLVWASVYGAVRDPAWTEDLVQETYLRAWESIGELRDPGAFRGWLLTTARRLAWRQAERLGMPMPETPEEAPRTADPEESRERVQEALQRLPERYRLPVTLHFLNGLDYAAIAAETGLANGSLRGLIARGAQKLRAELAPWWRKRHESS